MMFLKVVIISFILLGVAFIGLALRTLLVRNGRFPETSIGRNRHMQQIGISCARHEELKCRGGDGKHAGCGCA
jgi:hypothetical protein